MYCHFQLIKKKFIIYKIVSQKCVMTSIHWSDLGILIYKCISRFLQIEVAKLSTLKGD